MKSLQRLDVLFALCVKLHTVLARFLAHAPLCEHVPLLEYRHMEVNCIVYDIGILAFSNISQNMVFRLYIKITEVNLSANFL